LHSKLWKANPLIFYTPLLLSSAANDNKSGYLYAMLAMRKVAHVITAQFVVAGGQEKRNSLCKLLGHATRTWIWPMTSSRESFEGIKVFQQRGRIFYEKKKTWNNFAVKVVYAVSGSLISLTCS